MKTTLQFLTVLFLFVTTDTDGQIIPNSGFENWTIDIWDNHNPDNWETNNGDYQPTHITWSPGYQGSYSLRAENYWGSSFGGEMFSYAKCKFPVINHPTSLNAFVKTEYIIIDSVNIQIFIFYNGIAVDSGKWINTNLTPITTWTLISIPVTQFTLNADSVEIRINGGVESGTSVYVDELSFTLTGIKENENNCCWTVFPNPFSTYATLQTDIFLHNATLTIDNCFGQTVKQIKNISGQSIILQRDNLPNGLYFIQLTQDSKVIAADKLVIAN